MDWASGRGGGGGGQKRGSIAGIGMEVHFKATEGGGGMGDRVDRHKGVTAGVRVLTQTSTHTHMQVSIQGEMYMVEWADGDETDRLKTKKNLRPMSEVPQTLNAKP